jgi:acyl transferase domain-containing protein
MNDTDIAVIGLAGRFPGAPNLDLFWKNLCQGVESIRAFSDQELLAEGVDPETLRKSNYVKAGSILDDTEMFDAEFFGFNKREAEITDPQQRIFLECAWEALENAGHDPARFAGSIGVFAGANLSCYLLNNLLKNPALLETMGFHQTALANVGDFLSSRVAYKLNLKGPAVSVGTACSTSLVAVHLACQSLVNFECDMALAGASSLKPPYKAGYFYQEGGILSPDGHCRVFDEQAQGTIFGNGAGIVVLRRLKDAYENGDRIDAVIKGSAVNNDGSEKVGFTAPSVNGQARVIAEALGVADVSAESIGYIEAHGTGTALGDPIEIEALTKVFRRETPAKHFCSIGSVK